MLQTNVKWIAVDWGTSQLRAWLMGPGDVVLKELKSSKGMGALKQDEFEPALLELIGDDLAPDVPLSVLACGMVGAKQGWMEAPYRQVPNALPDQIEPTQAPTQSSNLNVLILPGLAQSEPADVMRGEETQISGFLSTRPEFTGVLCLPGTHAKWVQIDGGQIIRFKTVMTGELFAAISGSTILRFSVEEGWAQPAFIKGVEESLRAPQSLLGQFFSIRAGDILHGANSVENFSFLSGLLLGGELNATKDYWHGNDVHLIGGSCLSQAYASALNVAGTQSQIHSGDDLVLKGLQFAHMNLRIN